MGSFEMWCTNIGGSDSTRAVNTRVKDLTIDVILSDNGSTAIAHLNYIQASSLYEKLYKTLQEWRYKHPSIKVI